MILGMGDANTALKKALQEEFATVNSYQEVIGNAPLDPDVSNMNGVIFTADIASSIEAFDMFEALKTRHSKVVAMYVYRTESELELLDKSIPGVYKGKFPKYNPEALKEFVEDCLKDALDKGNISYADITDKEIQPIGETVDVFSNSEDEMIVMELPKGFKPGSMSLENIATLELPDMEQVTPEMIVKQSMDESAVSSELSFEALSKNELRARIKEAALDPEAVNKNLELNQIARTLMQESSEYSSAINVIRMLEKEMHSIQLDKKMNVHEKMDRIVKLAMDRTKYKEVSNELLTKSFLDIMEVFCNVSAEKAESIARDYEIRYSNLDVTNYYKTKREELDVMLSKRLEAVVDLQNISRSLQQIYTTIDQHKDELIDEVTNFEPSNSPIINQALEPIKPTFQPINATNILDIIYASAEQQRLTLSAVDNKLNELIHTVFKLYDYDDKIIQSQQFITNLLEVNRVEDIVIEESINQMRTRTFAGPSGCGVTVTALCAATAISRRENVILIDLSGSEKLHRYVTDTIPLATFYNEQKPAHLTIVSRRPDEKINPVMLEDALKQSSMHYRQIILIADFNDDFQMELATNLSYALAVVTDTKIENLELVKSKELYTKKENRALIMSLVQAEGENPLDILEAIEIDPFSTRIVSVPYLPEIRTAALRKVNPALLDNVSTFFESNF